MEPHAFNIEDMSFVSGLFWQPVSALSEGDKRQEIRGLAKDLSFNLYVVRATSTHCVGFGNTTRDVVAGTMSAAAIVSKTLEVESGTPDFIFVSQLPDGFWMYVAQRDGIILPDGDQCFPSEDGARSRLLEDVSVGEWSLIVAPSIWGIAGSVERDFVLMLPKKERGKRQLHKWWKLQPVDPYSIVFQHKGKLVVGFAVVIALVVGWNFYLQKYQEWQDRKATEEIARLAAERAQVVPPEHPWKTQPLATDMIRACLDAFSTVRLFPGNWDISQISCTGGSLSVSWKPREYGWIQHLKAIEPNAKVSTDGSVASVSLVLPTLEVGYNEIVETENQRLVDMYSAAQHYGVQFSTTPASTPVPQLPGQGGLAPVTSQIPPDWKEINWRAENVVLPDVVLAALSGNGFRMNSMSATWFGGRFIWTMEGKQYVQP